MPTRRETGLWIIGAAGLASAVGLGIWMFPTSTTPDSAPLGQQSKNDQGGLEQTTPQPLRPTEAADRLAGMETLLKTDPEAPTEALEESTASALIEALKGLQTEFPKLGQVERARATEITGKTLDRFRKESAPSNWGEALSPAAEILSTALADPVPAVRAGAIAEISRLWNWQPGRSMVQVEEKFVGEWKDRLHAPLIKLLEDKEPGVRMAAVQALGALPIDGLAAPALNRLRDENSAVRMQVLNSFAGRRDLLPEEDVIPRLFDSEPAVTMAANVVLRARGLNEDQIGLAKLLYHPKAEMRASAIGLLVNRTDIDPVVWLVQLSYDSDESVRSQALEALANRESAAAKNRVVEMARSDPSEKVRTTARQKLPEGEEVDPNITYLVPPPTLPSEGSTGDNQESDSETIAKLPPLPGLPALAPRAN